MLTYMETGSISQCQLTLEKIVRLFANESRRYFKDILEYDSYENLFTSVARLLVREKRDSRKTVSVKNFKALL